MARAATSPLAGAAPPAARRRYGAQTARPVLAHPTRRPRGEAFAPRGETRGRSLANASPLRPTAHPGKLVTPGPGVLRDTATRWCYDLGERCSVAATVRSDAATLTWAATIDDLYKVEGKAELVNGRIVEMAASGFIPNRVGTRITLSLMEYERRTGAGYAIGDNAGFRVDLPHRRSFSPDAAWYTGKPTGMKFLQGAPAFAVEVRSENDDGPSAEEELRQKRADYFAAGTQVVWDVDPLEEDAVRVYHTDNPGVPAAIYRRGDLAEAEPAVPGWRVPVDELFE